LRASWRHSLACAAVAEELAAASSLDKDAAYTGALIHDIGRLALAVMQPDQYNQLFQSTKGTSEFVLQRERELFGVDHCDAGRLLTTAWNLPQLFIDVTSHHHDPTKEGHLDLAGLIGLGCRMADALGFEFVPNPECESYQMLVRQLPGPVGDRMPADPNEVASRITDKISCIESMRTSAPAASDATRNEQRQPPALTNLAHPSQNNSSPVPGRSH
jgi:putative nucleotidyltransferase with HDIG domain